MFQQSFLGGARQVGQFGNRRAKQADLFTGLGDTIQPAREPLPGQTSFLDAKPAASEPEQVTINTDAGREAAQRGDVAPVSPAPPAASALREQDALTCGQCGHVGPERDFWACDPEDMEDGIQLCDNCFFAPEPTEPDDSPEPAERGDHVTYFGPDNTTISGIVAELATSVLTGKLRCRVVDFASEMDDWDAGRWIYANEIRTAPALPAPSRAALPAPVRAALPAPTRLALPAPASAPAPARALEKLRADLKTLLADQDRMRAARANGEPDAPTKADLHKGRNAIARTRSKIRSLYPSSPETL